MIKFTVLVFSAFVTSDVSTRLHWPWSQAGLPVTTVKKSGYKKVQCQMYTMPYNRPCQCGLPAMPVSQPCPTPAPLYAAPYEIPAAIPKMALPKMAIPSPAYELQMPVAAAPKMAMPAYELQMPVQAVFPNVPVMPAPYELALPLSLPSPSCGCLEALSRPVAELPLPVGLALNNPFLPAASPVSALAPFNPLLPPAAPCSRCQYLKKIPIPPPCI